jgi:NAD(P)-dependent dehydrogenase (short-subunit alcohol dehydrogenase family)
MASDPTQAAESKTPVKFDPAPVRSSVALVTGASSGIGWETVLLLAEAGWTVYAASRSMTDRLQQNPPDLSLASRIHALTLDVLDEASCLAAVATVANQAGHLDALVHCAGTGLAGSVEEIPLEDAIWQYDNLLFGTIRMLRAVLPHFRAQSGGRIIVVTSVAATIPVPFQTYYSSAKAAVHALALGLADEVHPFGIQVSIVAPGDTKTGFTRARRLIAHPHESPYAHRIARSVRRMERDEQNGMPAIFIARAIVRESGRKRPKLWVIPGLSYQLMSGLGAILPLALVRRIVRHLYA